jgi:hypothetical protein
LSSCFSGEMFVCNNASIANKYWFYMNEKAQLDQHINQKYMIKFIIFSCMTILKLSTPKKINVCE